MAQNEKLGSSPLIEPQFDTNRGKMKMKIISRSIMKSSWPIAVPVLKVQNEQSKCGSVIQHSIDISKIVDEIENELTYSKWVLNYGQPQETTYHSKHG